MCREASAKQGKKMGEKGWDHQTSHIFTPIPKRVPWLKAKGFDWGMMMHCSKLVRHYSKPKYWCWCCDVVGGLPHDDNNQRKGSVGRGPNSCRWCCCCLYTPFIPSQTHSFSDTKSFHARKSVYWGPCTYCICMQHKSPDKQTLIWGPKESLRGRS